MDLTRSSRLLFLVGIVSSACGSRPPAREPAAPAAGPPPARASDFAETLHGTKVRDPYRWLESSSGEARSYLTAYDAYARGVLGRIAGREALRRELADDPAYQPGVYMVGVTTRPSRLFYARQLGGPGDYSLFYREGWSGPEKLLLDVRTRSTAEVQWSIANGAPSDDGKHILAELHRDGSEQPHLEIVDVERGVVLPDRLTARPEPGYAWHPDGRSVFYSAPGGDVYEHELGGRADRLVFGASLPELEISKETYTSVSPVAGSRWLVGWAHPGTSGFPELFVAPLAHSGPGPRAWRRFATAADRVSTGAVHGDRAYLVVHAADERLRIVVVDLASGTAAGARELVAASDDQIGEICASSDSLYMRLASGGTGLRRLGLDGAKIEDISLPMKGVVSYVWCAPDAPELAFGVLGAVHEAFRYAPGAAIAGARLYEKVPDQSSVITERVEARSADGTMVPLKIVYRKGLAKDGRAPAFLNGYAAYGGPALDVDGDDSPWLRRGGVAARCGARGGGDKGEAWHVDGQKLKKENGIDDFIACASYLIEHGYTAPSRLTAQGSSAGGVLVGGAITKRPELFAAAILHGAIVNLMRLHVTPIGPANIVEFGDPAVAGELHAMLRSDPLHRIRDGVRYPAVLLRTGENDSRVPPWQAAKFAARLAAASASGRPILLSVPKQQGHLSGARDQEIENTADDYAFALWQSGLLTRP